MAVAADVGPVHAGLVELPVAGGPVAVGGGGGRATVRGGGGRGRGRPQGEGRGWGGRPAVGVDGGGGEGLERGGRGEGRREVGGMGQGQGLRPALLLLLLLLAELHVVFLLVLAHLDNLEQVLRDLWGRGDGEAAHGRGQRRRRGGQDAGAVVDAEPAKGGGGERVDGVVGGRGPLDGDGLGGAVAGAGVVSGVVGLVCGQVRSVGRCASAALCRVHVRWGLVRWCVVQPAAGVVLVLVLVVGSVHAVGQELDVDQLQENLDLVARPAGVEPVLVGDAGVVPALDVSQDADNDLALVHDQAVLVRDVEDDLDALGNQRRLEHHPLLVLEVGDLVLLGQHARVHHVEQPDAVLLYKLS